MPLTIAPVDSKRDAFEAGAMDDDDRPRSRADAASLLSGESLDRYSHDELGERIAQLEAEILRVAAHRARASAQRSAADALFKPRPE